MVFKQKTVAATKNKTPKSAEKPKAKMIQFEDDDSEDDDSDDDSEMEMDDLLVQKTPQAKTPVGKQTPNKKQAAKVEEDDDDDDVDEDDDDDVDEDEDDDVDEDEDDDVDEDEDDDDDDEEDDDDDDDNVENNKSLPVKKGKQENNKSLPVKKGKQEVTSPMKSPKAQEQNNKTKGAVHDPDWRLKRDLRTLFINMLPLDTTPADLKALSSDIVNVNMPSQSKLKFKKTYLFAFVEFVSEEKAEENYKILKSKTFHNKPLVIDYCGTKSTFKNKKEDNRMIPNKKILHITGIPLDATLTQISEVCPQAFSLILNNSNENRTAWAEFRTAEDANECLEASVNAQVAGKAVTVNFSAEAQGFGKRKQDFHMGPQNAKRRQFKKEGP